MVLLDQLKACTLLDLALRAYDQAVPARHRALLEAWAVGRCVPGSQCARQATELVRLLSAAVARPCDERGDEDDNNNNEAHRRRTTTIHHMTPDSVAASNDERKKRPIAASAAEADAARVRAADIWSEQKQQRAEEEEEALREQCIALLDGPERLLTMRRTQALALATLREALAQAQRDHTMLHEQETMRAVVARLEALEATVRARFVQVPSGPHGESEERALLKHLGRGIELMRRMAATTTTRRTITGHYY